MLLSNQEKQLFLTNAVDELSIMVWIKDKDGNLIYLNKIAMKTLFKCTDEQDIKLNKCPLKCNKDNIIDDEPIIEEIIYNNKVMYLKSRRFLLQNGDIFVSSEDITNEIIEEQQKVKLLNNKIDKWKDRREIKSKESNDIINNLLNTVRKVKKEKEMLYA